MKRITLSCSIVAALALLPGAAVAKPSTTDKQNAAKECKTLRTGMGVDAFRQLYGQPAGAKNALGKCVSKFAREEEQQREEAHSNAAKECKAERDADATGFANTYGTEKNAFGKCVSQKAKENKQEADEADEAQDEETVNSAKSCRAEQKQDADAFRDKYGTGDRKRNAFGKCVSQTSKEKDEGTTES